MAERQIFQHGERQTKKTYKYFSEIRDARGGLAIEGASSCNGFGKVAFCLAF